MASSQRGAQKCPRNMQRVVLSVLSSEKSPRCSHLESSPGCPHFREKVHSVFYLENTTESLHFRELFIKEASKVSSIEKGSNASSIQRRMECPLFRKSSSRGFSIQIRIHSYLQENRSYSLHKRIPSVLYSERRLGYSLEGPKRPPVKEETRVSSILKGVQNVL